MSKACRDESVINLISSFFAVFMKSILFQDYFRPRYLSKLATICFNECTCYVMFAGFYWEKPCQSGKPDWCIQGKLNLTVLNVCNNVKKTRKYCCWW